MPYIYHPNGYTYTECNTVEEADQMRDLGRAALNRGRP